MINQDIIKVKKPDVGLVTAKLMTEKIDKNGHIALDGLFFETGKSTITDKSIPALKNIAEYLNGHSTKEFLIVGHTDNVGDFDANLRLSKDRADAVLNELLTVYSVKAEQLQAYGDGSTAPVASNSTESGKATNRRVEIVEQ